ncbi:uncharacterized protein LOC130591045 [Beta vulgaris subsp. vulgaris]|uniref:uncharacterized protein LOC130591045 n=1 Tax=Beta vulgaris subsp. vulgaris TaxID=3555 RepID=UPI002549281C|nr:uncharacterized protein LOC130591045 [Beta vulgaris subsp. vulgaris]
MGLDERVGLPVRSREVRDMRSCMEQCSLRDIKVNGNFFTWTNKQEGEARVFCKLDRALGNVEWENKWEMIEAYTFPEGEYDHCPVILKVVSATHKKKPFRFFNMWCNSPRFLPIVQEGWQIQIQGTKMFHVVMKLKNLKGALKGLNKTEYGDISVHHSRSQQQMMEAQAQLHQDPTNILLRQKECEDLLGSSDDTRKVDNRIVQQGKVLSTEQQQWLDLTFDVREIKQAIFSITNEKAPGIDGYSNFFFKKSWDIIGQEVITAIQDFFRTGRMLQELNVTAITLIPKIKCPAGVGDYKLIACCSVIYKAIPKLICSRLSSILPELISPNQGAFIKGRSIMSNILLCQDLVKRFNKRQNQERGIMMKIDLRKAYDSVEWKFIEELIQALHFPPHFIRCIMSYIRTPKFTLLIKGSTEGFFSAKKGLRQGDPMSPLLFVIYDLLMFCKGEAHSAYLLLQGLKLFSETSGLQANNAKSALYCSGINEDEANRIQQHFLWSGKAVGVKSGYINWDQVCSPKKMGGLGLRNVTKWNLAAVGKLVWHIGKKKEDLWVKWIHSIYIKEQCWWSFSAPPNASSTVKQLCKVKDALSGVNMQKWQVDNKYSIATVFHTITHQGEAVNWDMVFGTGWLSLNTE